MCNFIPAKEREHRVMKKIRNQKWACLVLAVIVMISGICLERVPADAFFSCVKNTSFTGIDHTDKELSVYRAESLNQREVLNSLRVSRRDGRRSQTRVASVFCSLNVDILPHIFHLNQRKGDDRYGYETWSSLAILTYIHNQDGEKA